VTMHRRPLGQGRTLAAVAGVIIILGCFLPWWQVEPPGGLAPLMGDAFEGAGIVVFLAGIATLALVALPYARGDRPTGLDRWQSFAFIAIVGWIGFGLKIAQLFLAGAFVFDEPAQVFTNGPGIWLSALGLAILSRAVYQMTREPLYR
jgi:hypothetical protein